MTSDILAVPTWKWQLLLARCHSDSVKPSKPTFVNFTGRMETLLQFLPINHFNNKPYMSVDINQCDLCVRVCVCAHGWVSERERETDLQASLFSLPLSVLPDWLEVLEPVSVLVSCCCWCSGSSSRAFLRQMAANSILATGIAADWPSLSKHKNTQGLGWFWARGTSAVLVANYLSLSQCYYRLGNSVRMMYIVCNSINKMVQTLNKTQVNIQNNHTV